MKFYFLISIIITSNLLAQNSDTYYFKHHKIGLPIDNKGTLADVKVGDNKVSMRFMNSNVVYSGGFFLSGYADGVLWANAMATVTRVEDYLPGSYKYSHLDDLAKIYILKSSDTPFGESWQNWKNAVKLGADFYDGNNDGIYDPIDINGNGEWDLDEDRPDLLGEQTAWSIYKDAVPSTFRTFPNVRPVGIEIQQTLFASSINESFENTIFVRYRIENIGLVSDILDSVYFGAWFDPDIGNYLDDLAGSDTTINAGYAYQDKPDKRFDNSAPTVLVSIVQGPPIYIEDSTFIDVNSNNIFDETDTPITQAYLNNGFAKGISYIEGAVNASITSVSNLSEFGPIGHPMDNELEARNSLMGKTNGFLIDACNWEFGKTISTDCETIDGLFMYSGDPVLLNGWINTTPHDQRIMVNIGPFNLMEDKPIDIVVAYVIGFDPANPLLSLKDAKMKARNAKFYFQNNAFESEAYEPELIICIEPILEFKLEQNYPNPFNPVTKINYSIPYTDKPQNVTLNPTCHISLKIC
ncbi:MAG: hypothetical protein L3J41_14805 [Melioribacteraceae bacterium]|nr:hypothetical protein [Melioribacteraceae bacterium]